MSFNKVPLPEGAYEKPPDMDPAELAFNDIEEILRGKYQCSSWPADQRTQFMGLITEYIGKVETRQPGLAEKRKRVEGDNDNDNNDNDNGAKDEEDAKDEAAPYMANEEAFSLQIALYRRMDPLRNYLRQQVPYGSIGETTYTPQQSVNFEEDVPTFEVDAFLYDDEGIDVLCDAQQLSREYCKDCKSTNIGLTQLISHSFSFDQLMFLFCHLFPRQIMRTTNSDGTVTTNDIKKLVDVGSRFGIVLAAAHATTKIPVIKGIEISEGYTKVQEKVIEKCKLAPRASVACADVLSEDGLKELQDADVIFFHNVFEWFLPEGDQLDVWKLLAKNLRPGQFLIVSPCIEDSIKGAVAASAKAEGFDGKAFISKWVEELDTTDAVNAFVASLDDRKTGNEEDDKGTLEESIELAKCIHLYRVLAQVE